MRKAAFCYLFVFLILFLAGCAGGGESVGLSEKEEKDVYKRQAISMPPVDSSEGMTKEEDHAEDSGKNRRREKAGCQ